MTKTTLKFQTMPLRFRVWDRKNGKFVRWCGTEELDIWLLADWMGTLNVVEFKEDYIISQDTSLKDKNGNSIYAGDIVKFGEAILVVEYDYGYIKYSRLTNNDYLVCESRNTELIGNIWQNPELLKGAK